MSYSHAELRNNVVEAPKVMQRYELPALIDISTAYTHRSVDVKLNPQATTISSKIIDDILAESSGKGTASIFFLSSNLTSLLKRSLF